MPNRPLVVILSISLVVLAAPRAVRAHCWHDEEENPGKNWATAKEACTDFVKRKYPSEMTNTGKVTPTNNPMEFGCWDAWTDEDGDYSETYVGTVTATLAAEHCYAPMSGPYSDIPIGPAEVLPGLEYQTSQKNAIRSHNYAKCYNHYGSDLAGPGAQELLWQWLRTQELCPELWHGIRPQHLPTYCEAQVHHMIPRDANGCGCGENSAGNAMLVSAYINNKMSNKPPPYDLIYYVNHMTKTRCPAAATVVH